MLTHTLMLASALTVISTGVIVLWLVTLPFYALASVVGFVSRTPRAHQLGCRLHKFSAKAALWLAGIAVVVEPSSRAKLAAFERRNVIYLFNHTSDVDPFVSLAAVPGNTRFIYKKQLNYVPLMGCALAMSGHIAIDRGDRTKAINSLAKAEEYLLKPVSQGGSIAIFPEGTRSRTGQLQTPFKHGAFHVAKNTSATIVPVLLHGAFGILPRGSMTVHPHVVNVRCLEPVDPTKFADTDALRLHVEAQFTRAIAADDASERATDAAALPVSASAIFPLLVVGVLVTAVRALFLGGQPLHIPL